jgi:hypothetical protein
MLCIFIANGHTCFMLIQASFGMAVAIDIKKFICCSLFLCCVLWITACLCNCRAV